jgi:hypothetical protein
MAERIPHHRLPWVVRVALALHDFGRPLAPHLLMCVQMVRNGEGCRHG